MPAATKPAPHPMKFVRSNDRHLVQVWDFNINVLCKMRASVEGFRLEEQSMGGFLEFLVKIGRLVGSGWGEDMNYTTLHRSFCLCLQHVLEIIYAAHTQNIQLSVIILWKYLQCFLQTWAVLPCFPEQQGTWTTLWRKQFKSGLSQKILTWWFHIQSCLIFCDEHVSRSSESVCTWLCPLARTG